MGSSHDSGKGVFKKKPEIVSRKIAGEMLLVPVRGELADMQRIFTLNPVGEYIWEQLDGKKDLQGIQKGIVDTFDVEEEQARLDATEFINELLDADLIIAE